jgi:hypothetical protein
MDTIQDFTLHFFREIRTPSSEQYTIFYLNNEDLDSDWTPIGTFHVHIGNYISGILVLFEDLGKEEIHIIVEEIRDQILSSLELSVPDTKRTYLSVYSNCKKVEDLDWNILVSKNADD